MIKHILFDWDNTLSITEPVTFKLENLAATSLGYKPQTRKKHLETYGKVFLDALAIRFPGANVEKIANKVIYELMPKAIERGEIDFVSKKTINTLVELKRLGYKLHILTSRVPDSLKHIDTPDNPIRKYFDRVYNRKTTVYTKPDPRVFDIPLKELNAKPSKCVYVGDTPIDCCAKEAGIYLIISLESGIANKRMFKDCNIDYFVSDLSEVPEALKLLSEKVSD